MEELVEVLAHHIRDHWPRDDGDGVRSFDHMHSSAQQIAAAVLEKLSMMKRIGDGRYSTPLVFACEPKDFQTKASENRERGCSYDTVVLALLAIMEYGKPEDDCASALRGSAFARWTATASTRGCQSTPYYMKELYPRWTELIA